MFLKKFSKKFLAVLVAAIAILFAIWLFLIPEKAGQTTAWGVTFSPSQARYLDLDWKQTYQSILKDLNVRHLRLSANWNQIEPEKDKFYFGDLDYQLEEAQKNGAKVILAVGRKLPRWPECHTPEWAKNLPDKEQQARVLKMIRQVVEQVKKYDTIVAWQVENEPLLAFGVCPRHTLEFLRKEVTLVRTLDSRPIIITESGELSTWLRTVGLADILGISLYRTVWDKFWGYLVYPLTPAFYSNHAKLVAPWVQDVIITELQAEPWGAKPIKELTLEEQRRSMDLKRFEANIDFAGRTNFSQIYLWGVEYWYYSKNLGDDSLYNRAEQLFANSL